MADTTLDVSDPYWWTKAIVRKTFKQKVMEKAGFGCALCRKPAKAITRCFTHSIHHILPRKEWKDLTRLLPNVVYLCNDCHLRLHQETDEVRKKYFDTGETPTFIVITCLNQVEQIISPSDYEELLVYAHSSLRKQYAHA